MSAAQRAIRALVVNTGIANAGTGETGPHAGAIPHPSTPLTVIRLQSGFSGRTLRWFSLGY
mgnify:CR=1 FL=1